jgi:hypothetical protein
MARYGLPTLLICACVFLYAGRGAQPRHRYPAGGALAENFILIRSPPPAAYRGRKLIGLIPCVP